MSKNPNSPITWWQIITAVPALLKGISDIFRKTPEERQRKQALKQLRREEKDAKELREDGHLTEQAYLDIMERIAERRAAIEAE